MFKAKVKLNPVQVVPKNAKSKRGAWELHPGPPASTSSKTTQKAVRSIESKSKLAKSYYAFMDLRTTEAAKDAIVTVEDVKHLEPESEIEDADTEMDDVHLHVSPASVS